MNRLMGRRTLVFRVTFVLAVLLLISVSGKTYAEDLANTREVLKLISDFAKDMCGEIQSTGSTTSIEASGNVDVGLSGLFGKLAELGIEGAAGASSRKYEGVVREHLQKERSNNRECRNKIYLSLQSKLNVGKAKSSDSVCVISLESPNDDSVQKLVQSLQGTRVSFRWKDCPEAERYHLYVMASGAPVPIVDNSNLQEAIFFDKEKIFGKLSWSWKVRAYVEGKWGNWSEERRFTVK